MIKEIVDEVYREKVKNRINRSVDVGENGCWNWKKSANPRTGYGQTTLRIFGKYVNLGIHRCSWMCNYGSISEGKQVLHKCDNILCCNPEHLFLGTQKDNIDDMFNKKRNANRKGIKKPRKLNKEKIYKIVELYNSGFSTYKICKIFDISRHYCGSVIRKEKQRAA